MMRKISEVQQLQQISIKKKIRVKKFGATSKNLNAKKRTSANFLEEEDRDEDKKNFELTSTNLDEEDRGGKNKFLK